MQTSLVEHKLNLVIRVGKPVLELFPGQPFGKGYHGLPHVQDSSLLLINVRGVNDDPLQVFNRQSTCKFG